MSTRLIILPYKLGSNSARELQNVFATHRAKRVRPDGNYRPFRNHVILNWGCSDEAAWWPLLQNPNAQVINQPSAVRVASNKLLAFQSMLEGDVNIPKFTADRQVAIGWVNEGKAVVARKLLRGCEGRGIVIIKKEDGAANITTIEPAPLYVQYVKKQTEFRVHVFRDRHGVLQVIDAQQKKKRQEVANEDVNYQVRNARFGWVFCREGIVVPEQVKEQAKKAVDALGLDFSGVDVLYNTHYSIAYVVEANTAVGLEGTSIESYRRAILDRL